MHSGPDSDLSAPRAELKKDPPALRTPGSFRLTTLYNLLSSEGARQGYLAAIDQGAISLANFLGTIILARGVTPTELGVYGVGFTSLRLVRSIQEGIVIQPLNTIGASLELEEFKRYATNTTLIQVALALVSAAAVALGGWVLTVTGNDTAGPTLFALWFAFLAWQLQEHFRRIQYTRGDVRNALINTILANGARLALLVYWGTEGRLTGIAGLDAIAWGSLAALFLGVWQTRAYWTFNASGLRETWQRNWEFGRWVLGGSLANWLSVEFYPVLTAGLISFAAAGAYRALQNLVAPVHLLLRAIDTFLTPRAARAFDTGGRPALARLMHLTYLVFGIPVLGLLVLAVLFRIPLLEALYGKTYIPFSSGLTWMAVFYALWYAYWPLQTAFKAARISRPIFVSNLAAILAMLSIGIWMILRWGVYGTIAGQALNSLVVLIGLSIAWGASRQKT